MDADMDKVRRIMLEQQATFQEQLQELHRLYRVQKMLMLKTRDQRAVELGGLSVKTEPNVTPVAAPPPRRRRTFDLERPAEEYMDVDGELDEPRITTTANNNGSKDLAYKLNGIISAPSLGSSFLPLAGIETPGISNGRMTGKSEKEAEFLHMLKRAKGSDEAADNNRAGGFGFLGALSSPWYGPLENGSTEKQQNTPNGFHLGRGVVEDKGSKPHLQSELLSLHSKQSESSNQLLQIQQTAVFLDPGLNSGLSPGLNRLSSGTASCSVSSTGIDPTFNLNPFLSAGLSDENAKYSGRLQNHVSYSNQGILIPCSSASSSSGSVRRDAVLEGLWWKSNQGFSNQSVVPPVVGSVPSAWPGSGYISNHSSGSFHHSAVLGMQAVVPGGFKEENGAGWLRGNNHGHNGGSTGGSSAGFHYSASTPPKPPFKKPPKLILDGATMELKQVDSNRPAPGPARYQPDSLVAEETAGGGERSSVDGGCFVDGGKVAEIPKPLETDLNLVPVSVSSDKSSSEKQSGVLQGPAAYEGSHQLKSLDQKELEQDRGAELVQESGVGTGLVESCQSEANLGGSEDPVTCSCAQPGCRVCGKGSVEDGQMQINNWRNDVESSAAPREEVRENGEPPPPSGKKRRIKLLLATRETESGSRKRSEEGEISAPRPAEPESSKPEHGAEGERKRRKSSLGNSTSNNNSNSRRSSSHHHEPSKESKISPLSRHSKEKPQNGYSALDISDEGANLAAEILVSLAPRSAAPPPAPVDKNSNSSSRAHHKSRRKSIDALPTGVTTNRPVSPSPKSSVEPKDGKKKKKKKAGKSKSPAEEDPPKVSATVKSVKLGQTTTAQSDHPESGTERSSSKHKKKLVSKKQQLQQQQQAQNHSGSASRITKPSSSGAGGGNPSRGTTALNVVHSKTSRDGAHHHHKSNNHHHHGSEKKRIHNNNNNSSEHESLDHRALHHHSGGNSSDEITEKGGSEVEHEDSGWSRRSWGASARRKRMRRCKRSEL